MSSLNYLGGGKTNILAKSSGHELHANWYSINLTGRDREPRKPQHRNSQHWMVRRQHTFNGFIALLVVIKRHGPQGGYWHQNQGISLEEQLPFAQDRRTATKRLE